MEDGSGAWDPATREGDSDEVPGWYGPLYYGHLGSELAGGSSLSVIHFVILPFQKIKSFFF